MCQTRESAVMGEDQENIKFRDKIGGGYWEGGVFVEGLSWKIHSQRVYS